VDETSVVFGKSGITGLTFGDISN